MKQPKVKICGMTQIEQVSSLVNLGVDAIGVILHANSPRLISMQRAQELRDKIPAFVSMVGVFVDCELSKINYYSEMIGLDLLQLHGDESSDYAAQLTKPYIKAIRAKNLKQVYEDVEHHFSARAFLLDPYVKGQHGGTGQRLPSDVWPKSDDVEASKLILAGGLSPDNLSDALVEFSPYAVDLNSGLEKSPGIKDLMKVEKCLTLVKNC